MAITYTTKAHPYLDANDKVVKWAIEYHGTDGNDTAIHQVEVHVDCGCSLDPDDPNSWSQDRLNTLISDTYVDSGVEAVLTSYLAVQASRPKSDKGFDISNLKA